MANVGTPDAGGLSQLIASASGNGIHLVTVGYGMGNYNDALMEQLADRGDGFYSYVDTYAEAERLFTTGLTSTLTVVAEDAKAQVTFDRKTVASYRLLGYENRAIDDDRFEDGTVDAGELGAGHTVTALYEVRLVEGADGALGTVTLRHTSPGSGEAVRQDVVIERRDLASRFDAAAPGLRLAATVAAFAELMAGHPLAEQRGVTLAALAALTEPLVADGAGRGGDDAGRADAAELARLIALAARAGPPPDPAGE